MIWLNTLKLYKRRNEKTNHENSRKYKSNISKALKTGISIVTTDAVSQLCHEIVFGHYEWFRKQSVTILSAFSAVRHTFMWVKELTHILVHKYLSEFAVSKKYLIRVILPAFSVLLRLHPFKASDM